MKTSSTSRIDGSSLITKWSIKPADHKAVRVRDNQRRHRERVKIYLAELESRLSETQAELQQAGLKIEPLTRQLESVQSLTLGRCSDATSLENNAAGNRILQDTQRLLPPSEQRESSTGKSTSSHLDTTQLLSESESCSAHYIPAGETAHSAEHPTSTEEHGLVSAKGYQNGHSQPSDNDRTEIREEDLPPSTASWSNRIHHALPRRIRIYRTTKLFSIEIINCPCMA